jgi:MATE family multidrug resistance protein
MGITLAAGQSRVWRLAGPIMIANLSTPLLGAVDTAVVGHLPEPTYIGGVALGSMIFSFLFWGFGFLRMGTTGFAAQAFGSGDGMELRATLARPLLLALGLGVVLILLRTPIEWAALTLVEASEEVEGLAAAYTAIRIWSAPAALVNYALLGWLLGTQRARAALGLQIALNGINIVLDLIFVVGFGWGVEGVAAASVLAEVLAAIGGLILVRRALGASEGAWTWARIVRRDRLIALMKVNADILIRTLALVTAFAYFTARGAAMGDVTLAANAILMQLQTFMAYGLDGFSHAAEILAGGALGARDRKAFRQAVRVSGAWALAMALLLAVLLWLLGPFLVGLFTNLGEVRAAAVDYLPWLVVSPIISVWGFLLDGIFIGTTRTAEMRNGMMISLATFLLGCWLLIPALGNHGLWLALMIFMIARALTLGLFYPRLERSVTGAPDRPAPIKRPAAGP